jgi:hypothetical protein
VAADTRVENYILPLRDGLNIARKLWVLQYRRRWFFMMIMIEGKNHNYKSKYRTFFPAVYSVFHLRAKKVFRYYFQKS